jgi:hypothetical protein
MCAHQERVHILIIILVIILTPLTTRPLPLLPRLWNGCSTTPARLTQQA